MAFRVIVDGERCNGCEECLEACTVNVFEMKEGKSMPVHEEECFGCRGCVEVCKDNAITVEELQPKMSDVAHLLLKDIL